jgi:uncharacterized protein involved in type VI secretion and phage assembly
VNARFQLAAGNGVVVAQVIDLDDELGLNRIHVSFPYLRGDVTSWARLVSPMAGRERGLVMRPEVGDEVLVVYEQGDPQRAYVLGGLWSKPDLPPAGEPDPAANHWRFIRSRSGHLIKLDDTPGAERVEIEDKDGQRRLVIDTAGDSIALTAESGTITIEATNGDITVNAPSATVNVNAQDVSVQAAGEAEVNATTLKLTASADMTVEAGGMLTLKGSQISLN